MSTGTQSSDKLRLFELMLKRKGINVPQTQAIPRRTETSPCPLSFAQQRLWFLEQLEPGKPIYNLFSSIKLKGTLDIDALQHALDEIVRRHESLRTTFSAHAGQPLQIIHPPSTVPLPLTDLGTLPPDEREAEARRLAAEEAQLPFDLSVGPLLRARLLRLSEDEHVALLTMHHIVSDGWSTGVLVRELTALYEAYGRGEESPLEELRIQYGDYAVWQREWMSGEVLEQELGYWRKQLEGAPAVLELPTDRVRPAVQSYRGASETLRLSAEVSEGLRKLSRQEGVTLFMTLLAAWQTLLARYSNQKDVVVSIDMAGRGRVETQNLIGFFINMLVLRTKLSGNPTFRELLQQVRANSLEAYSHQDIPFEKLVEELHPERDTSYHPIFQVAFVLQNTSIQPLDMPGLSISSLPSESKTAKFDLTLSMTEGAENILGTLEYSTDLFDRSTIQRMLRNLSVLLEGVVADADQRIGQLPILTPDERELLLSQWNSCPPDPSSNTTIQHLFEEQAARTPHAIALESAAVQLTYSQLNSRANQLAHHLRELGVGPDLLVSVCLERSPELVIALLAILKAGAAYLPLDPAYPLSRLSFMLEDAQAPVLLTQPSLLDSLPAFWGQVITLDSDSDAFALQSEENPPRIAVADNLAYVSYTSGSTGAPKGVCVTHRAVARLVIGNWFASLSPEETLLLLAPVTFDASTFELWGSLLNGARLVIMPPTPPTLEQIAQAVTEHGVTTLWLTAGLFHLMVDEGAEGLKGVRQLLAGGDVLSSAQVEKYLAQSPGGVLINGYGPTENTTFTCCHVLREWEQSRGRVPVGKPVGGTEVYILDEWMQAVGVGVVGELYAGGEGLARGYLNRGDLTAERFVPHPYSERGGERLYRTGDLARYVREGVIEFVGRRDNQVKVRGFRIELGEIEAALLVHGRVREAVSLALPGLDGGGEKRLVAYVVSEDGAAEAELRQHLRERLPEYMIPSAIVLLDELPLNQNGKVDRHALPEPEMIRRETAESSAEARTPVEEVLISIWSEVLGVKRVGREDDFFDLGGHSLLATQVISRLRDAFSLDLPLRLLFEAPSPHLLGIAIEEALRLQRGLLAPPILAVPRDAPLPLSFAQQRLWLIDQLEPASPLYNIPVGVRLKGALDIDALQHALDEIVRRHESLRTTFSAHAGQPLQIIHPPSTVPLPLTDLGTLPPDEREAEARRLAAEEAQLPFDLSVGPLLRARLLRLSDDEHVALLTMHHIVSDGWSTGVLVRELTALYEAYGRGEESPLEELRIQYGDYAVWQREWMSGEVLEQELGYWRKQLEGAPGVLELPTDRVRPAVRSHRGAQELFFLSPELTQQLKALSRREGVTLFMTLLAAWQTLLARYSNQLDVVVGADIANRNRRETESLIGFFVNMMVLRTRLEDNPPFRELLKRVREITLDAYAHQDVPFEKLVEELQPERSLSHSPLFQVVFVLQNAPMGRLQLPGVKMKTMSVSNTTSKFDLLLAMAEEGERLSATLEYDTDLFDPSTVRRMISHFKTLLAGAVAVPDVRVSYLPMLSEEEHREILSDWSVTQTAPVVDKCVHELFEEQVARTPEQVAVIFEGESLTYIELNRRANQLAHHLRELGVGPDLLVSVCLERSPELVIALLAILKAGAAYLPLDPAYPLSRLSFMLEDAQAPVLLTQPSLLDSLPAFWGQVITLDSDSDAFALQSEENPPRIAVADNLAYVSYTSGSTGAPKGVCVTHRAVARLVIGNWFASLSPEETLLLLAPVTFDASTFELWGSLLNGARLVIMPPTPPTLEQIAQAVTEHGVTTLWLTAGLFHLMVDEGAEGLKGVRQLLAGGDVLSSAQVEKYLAQSPGGVLINGYGPTENTTFTCCHVLREWEQWRGRVPVGKPVGGTEVYILDEWMQAVGAGVVGELYAGGEGLARGYLNRGDLTAERFVPHPYSERGGERLYRTGDLARYVREGVIEFVGRRDNQVKVRGFRIELGEIEAALQQHSGVREVVVVARQFGSDDSQEKRLVAYVTAVEGYDVQQLSLEGLRQYLREHLPEYMIPSAVVLLDELPLNQNGKIDRHALPEPEGVGAASETEREGARTPVEEVVAAIFAEVLKIDVVGREDNFFDLGGHSLSATQVISHVRKACNVDVGLRVLFERPSVRGMAEAIEQEMRAGAGVEAPPIVAEKRGDAPPLSFAQQRLWFLDQLEPGKSNYNIPAGVRLKGELNIRALEGALTEVARRHETLRVTFPVHEGQPVQHVSPPAPVSLEIIDLSRSHQDQARREQAALGLAQEEAQRPFDLAAGPLWRAKLLRFDADDYVLLVVMHHIISDGWSAGVLIRELSALYESFASGQPSPLAELEIQYTDFARWQRDWLQGEVLETQLAYWKKQLAGAPPLLELPTDRPRPPVQTYHGKRHPVSFSKGFADDLKAFSRREGVTLYMTLLAAFDVLLYRYSHQEDIVVGTPIANRNRAEIEPLIGFFVNTLVLRTRLDGDPTFNELLKRVREVALGAYTHQDVPFEKLVEELQPERELSYAALFQVMFTLQNAPMGALKLPGVRLSALQVENQTSNFDLSLTLMESVQGLAGTLEYKTDLFDEQTISRMAAYLQRLLEAAVRDPEQRISQLPLMSREEQQELLVEFNETTRSYPPPRCLHKLFEEQASRTPEHVAVVSEEGQLTLAELNARANQLARYLRQKGVGVESVVGVLMERTPEMVVGLLGILKAGGTYVPLDSMYPPPRLAFMLEDAGVVALLTQERLLNVASQINTRSGAETIYIDRDWTLIAEHDSGNFEANALPQNPAYIIYTSGSTGVPKGVVIPHAAIFNHLQWMNELWPLSPTDRVFQKTPASFDASVWEFYAPLMAGTQLVLAGAGGHRDVKYLLKVISEQHISVIQTVPAQLQAMLDEPEFSRNCASVQRWFCGGEEMTEDLRRSFMERAPQSALLNMYGPTETTIDATFHRCAPGHEHAHLTVPIGRPIANMQAYILDANLRLVPVGITGELHLGGAGLARGYLNRPELTAERFIPDPFGTTGGQRLYKTGDVARYLPEGEIEFVGRVDHQVKLRGFRVELGEIEAALRGHADVRECVVVTRGGAGGGERLVAYVVGEREPNIKELRNYVRERLPEYMVPAIFVSLDELPLTPSGKIDRRALPEPAPDLEEMKEAFAAPRNPVEERLAEIWSEVLRVERVGINDNFFDLGGHSLLATQVISRVRSVFQVEIPLLKIFETPTIAGVAEAITEAQKRQEGEAVNIIASAGDWEKAEQLLGTLEELSEQEVDAMLAEIDETEGTN